MKHIFFFFLLSGSLKSHKVATETLLSICCEECLPLSLHFNDSNDASIWHQLEENKRSQHSWVPIVWQALCSLRQELLFTDVLAEAQNSYAIYAKKGTLFCFYYIVESWVATASLQLNPLLLNNSHGRNSSRWTGIDRLGSHASPETKRIRVH